MTTQVDVTELESGHFAVAVREGEIETHHKVVVSDAVLDALGMADVEPTHLVRESFMFLLDREPATSILKEFPLERIADYFPDYYDEIRRRVGRE